MKKNIIVLLLACSFTVLIFTQTAADYHKQAEQVNTTAMCSLEEMYRKGEGVTQIANWDFYMALNGSTTNNGNMQIATTQHYSNPQTVITCYKCNGSGRCTNYNCRSGKVTCPACSGTGWGTSYGQKTICGGCKGAGFYLCPTCKGAGCCPVCFGTGKQVLK